MGGVVISFFLKKDQQSFVGVVYLSDGLFTRYTSAVFQSKCGFCFLFFFFKPYCAAVGFPEALWRFKTSTDVQCLWFVAVQYCQVFFASVRNERCKTKTYISVFAVVGVPPLLWHPREHVYGFFETV